MKKLLSLTLATLLFASFAMAADNAPAKKATKKAAKKVEAPADNAAAAPANKPAKKAAKKAAKPADNAAK